VVSRLVDGCVLRLPTASAAASLRRLSDDALSPFGRLGAPNDLAPDDGPPLLPAALRVSDDIAELLSGADGDDIIAGVHELSARNRGIVELPKGLDRAVRVAVRDTGATHRQVKAKGRSLLEALKSISRGMVPVDEDGQSGKVKAWLKEGKTDGEVSSDGETRGADFLGEGAEWGVRLSVRKQKRLFEALENEENMARGKGKKKPPAPSEAATNYGPLEAAAYAVTRLPMTFGAQVRVMRELRVRAPGFVPESLLDFGAGPTPALWAAREVFGSEVSLGSTGDATSVTLVDASPSMMAFTRRLAKGVYDDDEVHELGSGMSFLARPSGRPLPDPNPWGITGPVQTVASLRSLNPRATFDMVVSGYSLGEIAAGPRHEQQQRILRSEAREKSGTTKRLDDTIMSLWSRVAPGGVLVLVEPGTPRGSKLIRRARALILDAEQNKARNKRSEHGEDADNSFDAHVVAPCQHDKVCPMDGLEGSTWCHFSQRVKRTEMHRQMLPRGRGPQHQDERFSYVVIRRMSRRHAVAEAKNRAAEIAAGERTVGFRIDEDKEEEEEEEDDDEDDEDDEEDDEDSEEEEEEEDHDDDEDEDHDDDEDVAETKAGAVAVASSFSWGRLVRPPIKRSRHVILDMCSADGELDRHIVARSHSWEGSVGKQGYKAARKSKWGDLWPYKDPRKLHETKDASAAELEEFFKDFEDFNMEDLKDMVKGRSTPVGVGSGKKLFQAKRPALVEEFVRLEREMGIDAMEERESTTDGKVGSNEE
jgi:ribosomal protein RSM22 (predicted rRNA methylase)